MYYIYILHICLRLTTVLFPKHPPFQRRQMIFLLFALPAKCSQEMLDSKQPLEGLEITFEPYTNEEPCCRSQTSWDASSLGGVM